LASAAIIFIDVSKLSITNWKENLTAKIGQILMGAIVALVVGFGLTRTADRMVGIHIPQFTETALFLSITSYSFFLMILAVLSLLGIRSIGVFALMLFFGTSLLSMAQEMMSPFYHDWVYSWLPMRFMIQGLRELFFFGKGLSWSSPVSTLVWIGVGSRVIILGSALKLNSIKERSQNQTLEG
jgi:ABC-type polysaccharide/polyol phosphate export permease